MLTGKVPWDGFDEAIIINELSKQVPPPMDHLPSDTPSALVDLIEDCLKGDPEYRPTLKDIKERLEEVQGEVQQSGTAPSAAASSDGRVA